MDGGLGPITRRRLDLSISIKGADVTLQYLKDAANARFLSIVAADPSQKKWLGGWQARAQELGDV